MRRLVLTFCLLGAFFALPSNAFEGAYLETVPWVPATDDHVLDLSTAFTIWPDVVILRSDSDVRCVVYKRPQSWSESTFETAADSILNAGDADVFPSAGMTFYGRPRFLLSGARTDTVWVDGYKQVY